MDDTTKKDATRLEKVVTGIIVGESADRTPVVNADTTNEDQQQRIQQQGTVKR